MRTTITLDADVAALVEKAMRERGLTFRQAVNDALRRALAPQTTGRPFRTRTHRMGLRPGVSLDKAMQLAAELEDEHHIEVLRKSDPR